MNLKEKGIVISIDDDGVEWLLAKTLPDRRYGARPLRRAIQRHIEDPLSEAFIRGQIRTGLPDRGRGPGRGAVVSAGRGGRRTVIMSGHLEEPDRSVDVKRYLALRWSPACSCLRPERCPVEPADEGRRRSSSGSRSRATGISRRRPCSSTSPPSPATASTSERLKEDFRRLWDTGFLDDLCLEVLEGTEGHRRPLPRGGAQADPDRRLPRQQGAQHLRHRGGAQGEGRGDPHRQLLRPGQGPAGGGHHQGHAHGEGPALRRGHPRGQEHRRRGQQLTFIIDDGPKTKVKEISFEGNEVFSDGKLRGEMKKIKPAGFFNLSWLGGKTTYTDEKWGRGRGPGRSGRLEDFYLNHGYVTARSASPASSTPTASPGSSRRSRSSG